MPETRPLTSPPPEPTHEQISQWINANPVLRPGPTGGPMIRVGTDWLAAFADAARWGAQFRLAAPAMPEPPAEALAARPLLEQMAWLQHSHHSNPWGQLLTLSSRAAAWLRENPPGQPVAIEPRGCPTPGACSCVEPATPPATEVVPVAVAERLPGEGETVRKCDDDWAWGQERSLLTGRPAPRWRMMRVSCLAEEAVNWLPSCAIPLPQGGEVEG